MAVRIIEIAKIKKGDIERASKAIKKLEKQLIKVEDSPTELRDQVSDMKEFIEEVYNYYLVSVSKQKNETDFFDDEKVASMITITSIRIFQKMINNLKALKSKLTKNQLDEINKSKRLDAVIILSEELLNELKKAITG